MFLPIEIVRVINETQHSNISVISDRCKIVCSVYEWRTV